MGKSRYVLAALAFLASGVAMSAAQASVVITVWGGNGFSPVSGHTANDASGPPPGTPNTATFTWNAPIDFIDNTPNNGTNPLENTFAEFFFTNGGSLADISGYSSGVGLTEAQFLLLSMSDEGSSYYSYLWITGTSGAGTATISHDDGASVYQGGVAIYSSPAETSDITQTFSIGAGDFQAAYIEANGSPSDLLLTVPAVPEASTWAMMLLGFAGVGFLAYRRRPNNRTSFRVA